LIVRSYDQQQQGQSQQQALNSVVAA